MIKLRFEPWSLGKEPLLSIYHTAFLLIIKWIFIICCVYVTSWGHYNRDRMPFHYFYEVYPPQHLSNPRESCKFLSCRQVWDVNHSKQGNDIVRLAVQRDYWLPSGVRIKGWGIEVQRWPAVNIWHGNRELLQSGSYGSQSLSRGWELSKKKKEKLILHASCWSEWFNVPFTWVSITGRPKGWFSIWLCWMLTPTFLTSNKHHESLYSRQIIIVFF